MPGRSLTIEQVLSRLTENSTRIPALTTDLTPAQLHTSPSPGQWSANDVLAHLRSCSDMWGDCIATIIAEDRPTIRAANPRTWINKTDYPELEFRPSLRSFTTQRANLLAVLEPLPHESWSRTATVTGAGKPLERTVLFYADWLAMNGRTSSRSSALSTRCECSNSHLLSRQADNSISMR